MADRKIDYDRGVIINTHQATGMDVFMYVDAPGKFLTAHGLPVADAIAKEAGFDIDYLGKERVKKERKQRAFAAIDAELADDKDAKTEIVAEKNGYQLVSTGSGRHHVNDPDGNRLTSIPLSLDQAERLMLSMAGAEADAAKLGDEINKDNKKK